MTCSFSLPLVQESLKVLELSAVAIPANTDAVARASADGVIKQADAEKFFGLTPMTVEEVRRELQKVDTEPLWLFVTEADRTVRRMLALEGAAALGEKKIDKLDELFDKLRL